MELQKVNKRVGISVPTSKSINNRMLILKRLYFPELEIINPSTSNDSVILNKLLNQPFFDTELNAEDAGTVFRFMTALLASTPSNCILTGTARMKERPISGLVQMLKECGADIEYIEKQGFPPLKIKGKKLEAGNVVGSENIESSQFYSALAMVAPSFEKGLVLKLPENLGSTPYWEMTLECMAKLGIAFEKRDKNEFVFHPYKSEKNKRTISIEADWSSASYFVFLPLIVNDIEIFIKNLSLESIQGDAKFIKEIAPKLGIELTQVENGILVRKIENSNTLDFIDFKNSPDLSLNLICILALLKKDVSFAGLESLAIKESNRTLALHNEFAKVGVSFIKDKDFWFLDSKNLHIPNKISFESYNDHRIAMALSYFSFFTQIELNNPDCVKKSFPNFWEELDLFL